MVYVLDELWGELTSSTGSIDDLQRFLKGENQSMKLRSYSERTKILMKGPSMSAQGL